MAPPLCRAPFSLLRRRGLCPPLSLLIKTHQLLSLAPPPIQAHTKPYNPLPTSSLAHKGWQQASVRSRWKLRTTQLISIDRVLTSRQCCEEVDWMVLVPKPESAPVLPILFHFTRLLPTLTTCPLVDRPENALGGFFQNAPEKFTHIWWEWPRTKIPQESCSRFIQTFQHLTFCFRSKRRN